jgi:hypothetical protein
MPRNFVYAPGLPGYGTRGVDGSAGLTGVSTYFSAYDGNSDSVTIKSKIISNNELFSTSNKIPGYPIRTYQTGDLFIDKNARIFQIDFAEANLYKDTGIFLNTSGFFSFGPVQSLAPGFERYSNSYDTQKYLIDIVYSDTVGDYTTRPTSIYDNAPLYFAQVKYIDQLLAPDFSNYYPFQVWTIGDSADDNAIALVRSQTDNLWRLGNYDAGSVKDVSLSLDFKDIYIGGTTAGGTIYGTFEGDASFNDVWIGGTLYGGSSIEVGDSFDLTQTGSNILFSGAGTHKIFTSDNATTPADLEILSGNVSGNGTYTGAALTFYTGRGGNNISSTGGNAGDFAVICASGGEVSGSGAGVAGGDGGFIRLTAGDGGYGEGGVGGDGGDIYIRPGWGGDASTAGDGGDIYIEGGRAGNSGSFDRYVYLACNNSEDRGQAVIPQGLTQPGLAFRGDSNTGFSRPASDKIGFWLGSTSPRLTLSYESVSPVGSAVFFEPAYNFAIKPVDAASGNGDDVLINGGDADAGDGGSLFLYGGDGTGVVSGGDVTILSGAGFVAGGNVNIWSGGTGTSGDILISSGTADPTDFAGNIELDVYTSLGTNGQIKMIGLPTSSTGGSWDYLAINSATNQIGNSSVTASDIKYKDLKGYIKNPLEGILAINGYEFTWNKKSEEFFDIVDHEEIQYGLVAQEVEKVFPEIVFDTYHKEKDITLKKILYDRMPAIFVEAIKEQQRQINDLKTIVENQQEQIDKLLKLL